MEVAAALLVGIALGWLLGRLTGSKSATPETPSERGFRPNKRQRKILATLPPDPARPTIDDLVAEEAAELELDTVEAPAALPMAIRLPVWKRDHPSLANCPKEALRFVVADHIRVADATAADVRLVCDDAGNQS